MTRAGRRPGVAGAGPRRAIPPGASRGPSKPTSPDDVPWLYVKVPAVLDTGESGKRVVADHVNAVAGAYPNCVGITAREGYIAVQCETVGKMAKLQKSPLRLGDAVIEWRTESGCAVYPLLIEGIEPGSEDLIESQLKRMGKVMVSLARVVVARYRLDYWTATIELEDDKRPPSELKGPDGELIAEVYSAHTHRVCPVHLVVVSGRCAYCIRAAAAAASSTVAGAMPE